MNTSRVEPVSASAVAIRIAGDALTVDLTDGRSVTVPLGWYPRLAYGSASERRKWRLIGTGEGIHWPDLDEDISVDGLLAGRPSGESQRSFERWLQGRGPRANQRMLPARTKAGRSVVRRRARG